MRIAVLHYQPHGEPRDEVVDEIVDALANNGHSSTAVAVDDRVNDILTQVRRVKPDLVFNVCETFAEDYRMEVNVAALLEMARIQYTGSGTAGLLLAQDKILTKQLLQFHRVLTPKFCMFHGPTFETSGDLSFPLIVKPAKSDASLGIGSQSIVNDWSALSVQVKAIRDELADDALAEEYIEGRELYVGVIGDTFAPEVLPVVELNFGKKWKKGRPRIADRQVKFGPETRGSPRLCLPTDLSDELKGRIERTATTVYRALRLRDYARVDIRLSARTNEPFVLEVNPNPYLQKHCEVALGAERVGLSYPALIQRIVDSAAARYGLRESMQRSSTVVPTVEAPVA